MKSRYEMFNMLKKQRLNQATKEITGAQKRKKKKRKKPLIENLIRKIS